MTDKPSPPVDVRMSGFRDRTRVETALEWIDRHTRPLSFKMIELHAAHGCVLAGDVRAAIDVPGFARAAMDGYALLGAETTGAGDYNPLPFKLIGESLPGLPFAREVAAREAVRIM